MSDFLNNFFQNIAGQCIVYFFRVKSSLYKILVKSSQSYFSGVLAGNWANLCFEFIEIFDVVNQKGFYVKNVATVPHYGLEANQKGWSWSTARSVSVNLVSAVSSRTAVYLSCSLSPNISGYSIYSKIFLRPKFRLAFGYVSAKTEQQWHQNIISVYTTFWHVSIKHFTLQTVV